MIKIRPTMGYLIGQLMRLYEPILAKKVAHLGIRYSQISFCMLVLHENGYTQDKISILMHKDKAATARTAATLEKNGFIERRDNPENKRQKLIYATDKLRSIKQELRSILQGQTDMVLSGFTESEKTQALQYVVRLIDNCRGEQGLPPLYEICEEIDALHRL